MSEVGMIASKTLYDGRIFTVQKQYLTVDGKAIERDVVLKNNAVVCLVKHRTEEFIILTKEFRVGTFQDEIGFVAGIVDEGEAPIEAAIRETVEETGYTPVKIDYLGFANSSAGFTNERIHHFYVEVDGVSKGQKLDTDENIKLINATIEDVFEMLQDGSISGSHAHVNILKCQFHGYIEVDYV